MAKGMNISKQTIRHLFLEMISVIVAVLLALWLNQWNKNRVNHHLAQRMQRDIIEEVQSNRVDLLENITSNQVRFDSLTAWIRHYRVDPENPKDKSLGFGHSLLDDTAWQNAQSLGVIPYMDTEFVNEVRGLYNLQDFYMEFANSIFSIIHDPRFFSELEDPTNVRANQSQLNTAMNISRTLVNGYRDFLLEIGADTGP